MQLFSLKILFELTYGGEHTDTLNLKKLFNETQKICKIMHVKVNKNSIKCIEHDH